MFPDFARTLICLAAVLAVGAGDTPKVSPATEVVGIDHIILGVDNLERGLGQVERLAAVKPAIGGTHPGRGTQNALISLGSTTYLEILAPVPGTELSDDMSYLASLAGGVPVGWAIATTDIQRTAQRLRDGGFEVSAPEAGSRVRPDGSKLEWKTLHVLKPRVGMAPFFIQWSSESIHPAKSSPAGCTLSGIELADPDGEMLQRLLNAVGLDVPIRSDREPKLRATLNCPKEPVVLGR